MERRVRGNRVPLHAVVLNRVIHCAHMLSLSLALALFLSRSLTLPLPLPLALFLSFSLAASPTRLWRATALSEEACEIYDVNLHGQPSDFKFPTPWYVVRVYVVRACALSLCACSLALDALTMEFKMHSLALCLSLSLSLSLSPSLSLSL